MKVPSQDEFPEGTTFHIKEFDVPLARSPNGSWVNWYSGKPREMDPKWLSPSNNWEADSFEQWIKVVSDSI